jgi:uncharacterized protein with PIN domain
MRFHLDESVDHAVARGLRLRGIDVTTATDAGLVGARDELHVTYACRDNRVILTHDDDFLTLAASGVEHRGIAYCAPHARTIGHIVRYVCLMHDGMTEEEMVGQVEYL